jgi:signal transduction histidine kinase
MGWRKHATGLCGFVAAFISAATLRQSMSMKARIFTLAGGLALMAVVVVLFGFSTISSYDRMLAEFSRVYDEAYAGERLNHLISNAVMESRGIYLAHSQAEVDDFGGRLEVNLAEISALTAQMALTGTPEMRTLKIESDRFVTDRRELIRVGREVSPKAAEAVGERLRPGRIAFQQRIEAIVERTRTALAASKKQADDYNQRRVMGFVGIALGGVVISILASLWLVEHFITRELEAEQTSHIAREKLLKELMQSNTELERFAYVASHDMQEPVRIVSIFSQMVARDYDDKLDAQGRQYLGIIRDSSQHMLTMVRDLLNYARLHPEAADEDLVDMNVQLKHVKANLGEMIAGAGAVIDAPNLSMVSGSSVQIQRLLQNLIANAIKYRKPEETPLIRIEALESPEEWIFGVRDNGLGIEPQFIGSIFEPFRRLHTWDQVPGTGLGLSICRKIVEHHGGRIWVESTPHEGSVFWFSLKKPATVAQPLSVQSLSARVGMVA